MTNPQGRAWETAIEKAANRRDTLMGLILVKRAQKGEADLQISNSGVGGHILASVFWKRIIKNGKKVRQPMGERYVAVFTVEDALFLLDHCDVPVTCYVQAKWTEQLSVTKVLHGLRKWAGLV